VSASLRRRDRLFIEEKEMEAIVERCCGLDVHQASVVACLLVGAPNQKPRKEVRSFGTMTDDLLRLKEWLKSAGCTHVGMESTGIYWMPVYALLEGSFQLIVGNAGHIKNVPGRKTDVKDSEWIADLLRHGLIRSSFVPPRPLRELRDLLRYRRKLVEGQTAERNRLLKLLETANIKLASVVSDVFGVSGRRMLRALLDGTASPEQMAELAKGQLRKKSAQLARALDGRVEEHHRFILAMQLEQLEHGEAFIAKLDARIEDKLLPYQQMRARLMQIPGVDRIGAGVIIAELGIDMTVFPTVQHAAAWAGVCPGNNESAGKHRGAGKRKGNVHLTTALVQAAVCAARKKGSYLKEKFWRLKARRGPRRAAMAVAHKILIAAYHILSRSIDYNDLGPHHLDRVAAGQTKRTLVKRLERLGYRVSLETVMA
jgi:transposase